MYPELCKHAHSHHEFSNNLSTMYFNAYPELHKHARSLLVYFLHNLGTCTALTDVNADVISGLLSINVNISRKYSLIS